MQQIWVCSSTLGLTKATLCVRTCSFQSHFPSLNLCHTICFRAQKATPASLWPSEGRKGLLEWTDLLRRSIYGQNNLEQRFHFLTMFPTGSICNTDGLGQSNLYLFFFFFFNNWSTLYGVSPLSSMRNIVQSLIHLLVLGLKRCDIFWH